MKTQNSKKEKISIAAGLVLLVACFGVAAKNLPNHSDYCKEPQSKCELNYKGSILNIVKTLKQH